MLSPHILPYILSLPSLPFLPPTYSSVTSLPSPAPVNSPAIYPLWSITLLVVSASPHSGPSLTFPVGSLEADLTK